MLLYLATGMTTTQYALRVSVDALLFGEGAAFNRRRQVCSVCRQRLRSNGCPLKRWLVGGNNHITE